MSSIFGTTEGSDGKPQGQADLFSSGLFANPANNAAPSFGASQNNAARPGLFGNSTTSTGLFGGPSANATGGRSVFNTPKPTPEIGDSQASADQRPVSASADTPVVAKPTTSLFGGSEGVSSLFGKAAENKAQPSLFGPTQGSSLFGGEASKTLAPAKPAEAQPSLGAGLQATGGVTFGGNTAANASTTSTSLFAGAGTSSRPAESSTSAPSADAGSVSAPNPTLNAPNSLLGQPKPSGSAQPGAAESGERGASASASVPTGATGQPNATAAQTAGTASTTAGGSAGQSSAAHAQPSGTSGQTGGQKSGGEDNGEGNGEAMEVKRGLELMESRKIEELLSEWERKLSRNVDFFKQYARAVVDIDLTIFEYVEKLSQIQKEQDEIETKQQEFLSLVDKTETHQRFVMETIQKMEESVRRRMPVTGGNQRSRGTSLEMRASLVNQKIHDMEKSVHELTRSLEELQQQAYPDAVGQLLLRVKKHERAIQRTVQQRNSLSDAIQNAASISGFRPTS